LEGETIGWSWKRLRTGVEKVIRMGITEKKSVHPIPIEIYNKY
jgi:hypothetical protein